MTTPDIPPIIGFTGFAGSGKTTATNALLRKHLGAQRLAFADPLKRMTRELLRAVLPKGWEHDSASYIADPVLKETPIPFMGNLTAREIMQTLGTEWGRKTLHEDFWVQLASGKVERLIGTSFKKSANVPLKLIFDDVRFANEADMIRRYGGIVVLIDRPGTAKPESIAAHASEALDFDVDMTILNDGTVEDLADKVVGLFPPPPKNPAKA